LRAVPDEEAAGITVTPGEPGTLVLTHRPHKVGGKTYVRVTIIDKATHLIREHQLRSGDGKTILARAEVPEGYARWPVSGGEEGGREAVLIPKRLKLSWIQEGFDLDVTFRDVRINAPLTAQRDKLFVEPDFKGYTRVNLAEAAGGTTIRESRPAPPSTRASGIRLRAPAAIDGDESAQHSAPNNSGSPLAFGGAELTPPSMASGVVGGRFPAAPEPEAFRPENTQGWRTATSPVMAPE
jgi:hypothetical protein